jgi:hypothetical protein
MDIVRGQRLARVKFVALPMVDETPGNMLRGACIPGGLGAIREFVSRVIGRLVAARP